MLTNFQLSDLLPLMAALLLGILLGCGYAVRRYRIRFIRRASGQDLIQTEVPARYHIWNGRCPDCLEHGITHRFAANHTYVLCDYCGAQYRLDGNTAVRLCAGRPGVRPGGKVLTGSEHRH